MSNINSYLAKLLSARFGKDVRQTIHDAISEINDVARTAQNSATASASSAKASETSASASASSAKASAALAEQYKQDAFAGTPDGYAELVENVRLMDIKTTTDTTLADSKEGGHKLVSMTCASEQDGTPTVDYPIAIMNTGDCVSMKIGRYEVSNGYYVTDYYYLCSMNHIPCNAGEVVKILTDASALYGSIVWYKDGAFLSSVYIEDTDWQATAPSGATDFVFNVHNADGVTVDEFGKITLTVNGEYITQFKNVWKNIFKHEATTTTKYGIAFTVNADKSVTATGTATADAGFDIGTFSFPTKDENYYVSGINESNYSMYMQNYDWTGSAVIGTVLPSNFNNLLRYRILVKSGATINKTFYPMIRKADIEDDTYEPYTESIATIRTKEPFRDCDVLFNVDGVWKIERNGAGITDDGTNSLWKASSVLTGAYVFSVGNYSANPYVNGLCSHAKWFTTGLSGVNSCHLDSNGNFLIYTSFATLDEWNAHLQEKPITIQFKLATPTIEVLDTDSQIALNSLKTFDGVTYTTVASRTPPSEIKSKYGTSEVGAMTLKNELRNDTLEIKYNELAVALVALGSEV